MGFSNFRVNVLLRVLILAALCFALAWSLANTSWLMTPAVCVALMALGVFELIRYVERTSRGFASFLNFVASHDYSTPLASAQQGAAFGDLQGAYRLLTDEFQRLNRQKAANQQYLEAVIEHVGVALCCFDEQGMVKMLNDPARRLFGVPHLHSVRSFARVGERLPEILQQLGDGERTLLRVRRADESLELVLYATTFELLEQRYKLVSFQDIRDELDRQEIDSWQKLIRVLTHEIMNSVTPIISLSRLMRETLVDDNARPPAMRTLQRDEQEDVLRSVTAIHTRSSGLLDFVQAYRSFAKLPTPVFSDVEVCGLLERVRTLMSQEIEERRIAVDVQCEAAGMVIRADAQQAEQVLINLMRNAVEALAETPAPRIELRGVRGEEGRVLVQVIDNGAGIAPEHLDNIFVPFFTTKHHGSGVGLSVSRQIMQANRGFISVRSAPGQGSVFTLKFQ